MAKTNKEMQTKVIADAETIETIAEKILKKLKPLLNTKADLFFKVGMTIKEEIEGFELATQRKVIKALKEKVDVYSKGYMWESYNICMKRPELEKGTGKLTLSHYRILYRNNIPEEVRGMMEDQAKANNWSVRDLSEKIADYKTEKRGGFKNDAKEEIKAITKEIIELMNHLNIEDLKQLREKAREIKENHD